MTPEPERLRAWTWRRQMLDRSAAGALDALRAVVGVYSTHPTAPLSLWCRCAAFRGEDLFALEQRREVLRLPAMRQSIFLLPAEDAAVVFAATRKPLEKRFSSLEYAGLDWEEYARLKPRLLERMQAPISVKEAQESIPTGARMASVLHFLGYEGLALRLNSSLRGDSLRYVAAEAWLGHPLDEPDTIESRRWLANAYLRSFGPARVRDFAWWSGLSQREAFEALIGIETVDLGQGLLLPADLREAFEAIEPLDHGLTSLLPKWDAYTMAYASDGRQRLVEDRHLQQSLKRSPWTDGGTTGDGLPLLLRGGRAVGAWAHKFQGDRMQVQVTPFVGEEFPIHPYADGFTAIGRLLGAKKVEL